MKMACAAITCAKIIKKDGFVHGSGSPVFKLYVDLCKTADVKSET